MQPTCFEFRVSRKVGSPRDRYAKKLNRFLKIFERISTRQIDDQSYRWIVMIVTPFAPFNVYRFVPPSLDTLDILYSQKPRQINTYVQE